MSMAEVLDSALSGAIGSATIECPPTDGSTAEGEPSECFELSTLYAFFSFS